MNGVGAVPHDTTPATNHPTPAATTKSQGFASSAVCTRPTLAHRWLRIGAAARGCGMASILRYRCLDLVLLFVASLC